MHLHTHTHTSQTVINFFDEHIVCIFSSLQLVELLNVTVKEGHILEGLEPVIAEVVSHAIVHAKQVFCLIFVIKIKLPHDYCCWSLGHFFCFTINSGDSFCALTSLSLIERSLPAIPTYKTVH